MQSKAIFSLWENMRNSPSSALEIFLDIYTQLVKRRNNHPACLFLLFSNWFISHRLAVITDSVSGASGEGTEFRDDFFCTNDSQTDCARDSFKWFINYTGPANCLNAVPPPPCVVSNEQIQRGAIRWLWQTTHSSLGLYRDHGSCLHRFIAAQMPRNIRQTLVPASFTVHHRSATFACRRINVCSLTESIKPSVALSSRAPATAAMNSD